MTRYILDVDISADNKYAIVSSYYIEGENATPQINCFRFDKSESVWNHDFDGSVAVDVKYESNGSVIALFEWGISILDSKGNEKNRIEFSSKIPQAYCFSGGKYNAIALGESKNGASQISVFDNNGKTVGNIELDSTALSVAVSGDRVAVLTRTHIRVYTALGNVVFERDNKNDGTKIVFSDKNSVLVVSDSDIVYNLVN